MPRCGRSISAAGSPVEPGELPDVLPLVAVLGRLFASPNGVDGCVEELHLPSGVVVVVLALDLLARERQEPRDRVAVRAIPGMRHRERAGGVRGHHLDLHPLRRRWASGTEPVAGGQDLAERFRDPCVGDVEIDEAWACGLGALGKPSGHGLVCDLGRELARRLPPGGREPQRDVRRVVAVLGVRRPL